VFLDPKQGEEAMAKYETALLELWDDARHDLAKCGPQRQAWAIENLILAAARRCIPLVKVVPGRTKGWWSTDIKQAITSRRERYKAHINDKQDGALHATYLQARQAVRELVDAAKEAYHSSVANEVNQAYAESESQKHCPLGKKTAVEEDGGHAWLQRSFGGNLRTACCTAPGHWGEVRNATDSRGGSGSAYSKIGRSP
jgi:hypothetical protein